jgi:hypothetical protein
MMNDDLLHRVSLFLDNELDQTEKQSLLAEIENNEQYQSLINREQSFKSFVKSHVSRPNVSPALIQSIKEKIRVSPS